MSESDFQLYNYAQAARKIGVSAETIRRMVREGRLRTVTPRIWPRIPHSEIERLTAVPANPQK